jgi:hypothetical protein
MILLTLSRFSSCLKVYARSVPFNILVYHTGVIYPIVELTSTLEPVFELVADKEVCMGVLVMTCFINSFISAATAAAKDDEEDVKCNSGSKEDERLNTEKQEEMTSLPECIAIGQTVFVDAFIVDLTFVRCGNDTSQTYLAGQVDEGLPSIAVALMNDLQPVALVA